MIYSSRVMLKPSGIVPMKKTTRPTSPRIATGVIDHMTIRRSIEDLRYHCQYDMRNFERMDIQMEAIYDEMARRLIFSLAAKVAAKKYEVKTVRYPATWLEAVKERFIPQQWQHLWPVKYEEVTLEANAYHPDIAIPGHASFVEILHCARMREFE